MAPVSFFLVIEIHTNLFGIYCNRFKISQYMFPRKYYWISIYIAIYCKWDFTTPIYENKHLQSQNIVNIILSILMHCKMLQYIANDNLCYPNLLQIKSFNPNILQNVAIYFNLIASTSSQKDHYPSSVLSVHLKETLNHNAIQQIPCIHMLFYFNKMISRIASKSTTLTLKT